jgi:hypothetical protein
MDDYTQPAVGYLPSDKLKLVDHSLVGVMSLAGIALVVCDGVRGRDRLGFLLKAVMIACAIVAFIGALQSFGYFAAHWIESSFKRESRIGVTRFSH